MHQEGRARQPGDIDVISLYAIAFPRHLGGVLYANRIQAAGSS